MCLPSLALFPSLAYHLPPHPMFIPRPVPHLAPGGTTQGFLRAMNCSANFAVGYNLMALLGTCLYCFSCVVSPVAFGKVVAENSGEFCRVKAIIDSCGGDSNSSKCCY